VVGVPPVVCANTGQLHRSGSASHLGKRALSAAPLHANDTTRYVHAAVASAHVAAIYSSTINVQLRDRVHMHD
jgi:hypothetical protein